MVVGAEFVGGPRKPAVLAPESPARTLQSASSEILDNNFSDAPSSLSSLHMGQFHEVP